MAVVNEYKKDKLIEGLLIVCPVCGNEIKFPTAKIVCPKCKRELIFTISKLNKTQGSKKNERIR